MIAIIPLVPPPPRRAPHVGAAAVSLVRSASLRPQVRMGSEAVAPTQTPETLVSQLSSTHEPGKLALLEAAASDARRSHAVRSALAGDAGVRKALARLQREAGECQIAAAKLLCELGLHLTPGGGMRAPRRSRGVSVLALDGGGTRAVLTLQMLKQLERLSGRRVNELFDVIGGTSTGGILALGIQQGYALDELLELYLSLARLVFRRDPFRHGQLLLTGGAYRTAPLETILRAKFAPEGSSRTSMLEARAAQEAQHAALHAALHAARRAARGEVHGAPAPPPPPAPPAHAFVVSCLASRSPPEPYLLRNYEYPAYPPRGLPNPTPSPSPSLYPNPSRPAARASVRSPVAAARGASGVGGGTVSPVGGGAPAGNSAEPTNPTHLTLTVTRTRTRTRTRTPILTLTLTRTSSPRTTSLTASCARRTSWWPLSTAACCRCRPPPPPPEP